MIDKYVIKQFISKIIIILFSFITIFLLVDIIDNLDSIMDSKMSNLLIIKYYIYSIPWYLSIGLPMSLLLGIVFTMSLLQKNNELTAIKASGISFRRISIPILLLGFIFSILSFYFDNIIVTKNLQKRNEVGSKYNLSKSKKNKIKQTDIFRQETSNQILGIKRYKFRNKTAHNISLQKFENGNLLSRLDAPIMKWNSNDKNWILPSHYKREWINNSMKFNQSNSDSILILNFTPLDLTQATVKPEEMNYWELKKFVNKLKLYGIKDPRWAVNMYFKTAFACTSFLMILFGLSLSISKPRNSLTVGIGISIFVIFIYYAGIKTGQSLGYKGSLPPILSVWLPNFLFFITGIYLFKNTRT